MDLKNEKILIKNKKIKTKNVLKLKNKKKKNIFISENKKEKIKNKCNKKITKAKELYKEIYLKINEFNNNGKKTIVYFIDSFYPNIDGVFVVMENYVKYMMKYYNIVVCAPRHNKNDLIYKEYFVLYSDSVPLRKQGYDLAFPQLDNKFQKFISLLKIDLIHIHSPFNMGSFGITLAKKRKIPCISTFHSQYKRDFYENTKSEMLSSILTKIILNIYQKSTLTLTMNEFSKDLIKKYGLKKEIKIIPNATSMTKKNFENKKEKEILEKYKFKNNKFNIIFIGRLVAVKNVYFILEVLKELISVNNNFNFYFIGDGPEKNKMLKITKNYKIEKNVNFLGKILDGDEKAIIIKNSNLLFFPSEYDTDGIVKMECACYDVPTLCLENTGAASTIIDNRNGFLEKADTKKCAEKLNYLINNVKKVKKIGKFANLEIYKTWDNVCEELNDVYKKMLKNKTYKTRLNKLNIE